MSEQDFNKKAQDLIKASGGYVIKTESTNRSGTHDILACIKGRFCSFEGKIDNNKMSELQVAHQIEVIKAGGLALEIKTLNDVRQVIEWALSGHKQAIPDRVLKKFYL